MRTVRPVHAVTAELGLSTDYAWELSKETSTFVKTKRQSLDKDDDLHQTTFHEYSKEFLLQRGPYYFNGTGSSKLNYLDDFDEIAPLIEEIMYRQLTYRRENSTRSASSTKRSRDTDQADGSDTQRRKVVKLSYHRESASGRCPHSKPRVRPATSPEDQNSQSSQVEEIDGSQHAQVSMDPHRRVTSSPGFVTVNEIPNQGRRVSVPASKSSLGPEEQEINRRSRDPDTIEVITSSPAIPSLRPQMQAPPVAAALLMAAGQKTPDPTPSQAPAVEPDRIRVVKYSDGITQTVDTHLIESRPTQTVDTHSTESRATQTAADDTNQPVKYSDGSTQTVDICRTESKETQTMTTDASTQESTAIYMLNDGKIEVHISASEGNQIFKLIIERLKAQVNDYSDKIEGGWDSPRELECYQHTVSQISHTVRLAELRIRKAAKVERQVIN